MSDQISLEGLSKAKVLAGLYNASRPLGMGFMQYDPAPMTEEEAASILEGQKHFDYLKGRVMKMDLSGDSLDPWGYDRDNGVGAAQVVIGVLRQGEPEDGAMISGMHVAGKADAVLDAREGMKIESGFRDGAYELGLADIADVLGSAIDRAE